MAEEINTQPAEQTPETDNNEIKPTAEAATQTQADQQERNLAGLGYIPLLAFISITLKPDSKYCTFHGNQGIAVTILWFIVIFWLMLAGLFDGTLIGNLIAITGSLVFLALFALNIISLYKGYKGEMWEIPVIGPISQKMNFGKKIQEATGVESQAPKSVEETEKTNEEAEITEEEDKTTEETEDISPEPSAEITPEEVVTVEKGEEVKPEEETTSTPTEALTEPTEGVKPEETDSTPAETPIEPTEEEKPAEESNTETPPVISTEEPPKEEK
ncbi:hypothetical protein KKG71_00645 [Patescibacteria group bacterium]|nr:hypothetical protein [Patescibacteria group bacterium]